MGFQICSAFFFFKSCLIERMIRDMMQLCQPPLSFQTPLGRPPGQLDRRMSATARCTSLHIVAHVQCVHYVHRRSWKYATHPTPHTLSPPHSNKMHSPLLRARPRNTQHPRAFLQQGGGVSNLIMRGHKRPGHIF